MCCGNTGKAFHKSDPHTLNLRSPNFENERGTYSKFASLKRKVREGSCF